MINQKVAPGDRTGGVDIGATTDRSDAPSAEQAGDAALAAVISMVTALVPPMEAVSADSTWVERRTDEFDMKSAYGSRR